MRTDKYGQVILSEKDLCDLYMKDHSRIINNCFVETSILLDESLELQNVPKLITYIEQDQTLEDFDKENQANWKMPDEYHNMDIAKWLLDQCKTDTELQRVGEELLLYLEKDLFKLLQYLKYLVDTMRKYNIVWGVGRGSSVSSYILYLIGVHKIDSIYYDLDVKEFLR